MSHDPALLVGRLATDLADGAPLADALGLLVDGWGLRSAVLRRAAEPCDLLAVAGDVVRAVPGQRHADGPAALEIAVPACGVREFAVLVVSGARPSLLPALRAAAAVLGLALAAAPAPLAGEVAAVLLEADQDAAALADRLHDGPVQALLAARYACDAVVRGGDPAWARDAVQEAVVALRRTLWHVRPRGAHGLPVALAALSERLAEAGHRPLVLALDTAAADRLPEASRAAVFRLVQAVAHGAGPVRVAVRGSGDDVLVDVDVDGGLALDGPDRWRRRLRALGGDLSSSAGRLRLALPAPPHSPALRSAAPPSPLPVRHAAGSPDPTREEACS